MAVFKKRKTTTQVSQAKRKVEEPSDDEERDEVEAKKPKHDNEKAKEKAKNGGAPSAYSDHSHSTTLEKEKEEPAKAFGPAKSQSIRATTIIDYQPDVCKDYKQTGFCGFGDNCKFLHAREDYAAGWQLDKQFDEQQQKETGKTQVEKKEQQEQIPFKCVLCKQDYKSPVVTQCNHYYCEQCFMKRYRKKPACFICGKDTHGIAKPAKNLKDLISSQSNATENNNTEQ